MKNDEVANVFVFLHGFAIEVFDVGGIKIRIGKQDVKPGDRVLDQEYRSRLEWLEEARAQSDGDAILHPERLPAARAKADKPRIRERGAIEIAQQQLSSRLVVHEGTGKHMAIAS